MSKDASSKSEGNTRDEIVNKQTQLMLQIIKETPFDQLKNVILTLKFEDERSLKPDAIAKAIEFLKNDQTSDHTHIIELLDEEILPEIQVKPVKTRKVTRIGEKSIGVNAGSVVKKIPEKPRDHKNISKLNRPIQSKATKLKNGEDSSDDIFFEYLACAVFSSANMPKFRLYYSEKEGITGNSTYIDNFQDLHSTPKNQIKNLLNNAENFGEMFARTVMLGDYDINNGNVGIREDRDGRKYFCKIDFGRAFSYTADYDWQNQKWQYLNNGRTAALAKQRMVEFSNSIYSEERFHGVDFACSAYKTANEINEKKIRNSLNKALNVLQSEKAFGPNALETSIIQNEITKRLNIPEDEITQERIVDQIIIYMKKTQEELKQMAIDEAKIICHKQESLEEIQRIAKEIPEALNQTIQKCIECRNTKSIMFFKKNFPEIIEKYNISLDLISNIEQTNEFQQIDEAIKNKNSAFLSNQINENPSIIERYIKHIILENPDYYKLDFLGTIPGAFDHFLKIENLEAIKILDEFHPFLKIDGYSLLYNARHNGSLFIEMVKLGYNLFSAEQQTEIQKLPQKRKNPNESELFDSIQNNEPALVFQLMSEGAKLTDQELNYFQREAKAKKDAGLLTGILPSIVTFDISSRSPNSFSVPSKKKNLVNR